MTVKKPSFRFSLITLFTIIAIIAGGMIFFKLQLHLLMMICWVVCAILGRFLGFTYDDLEKGAYELISKSLGAVLILMAVGALIGAWISSGTVPAMIYVGLKTISPEYFLVTVTIICSVTALTTGTSWGTIGTVGVALMGVGSGLGFEAGMTAGAIICGAFLGDKISPLSDTTNMAAAINGVPVFTHIKHMINTALPAYIITLVIYYVLGMNYDTTNVDLSHVNSILNGLRQNFDLNFLAILPMFFVLILLLRKTNPVLAILSGAIFGVVIAVINSDSSFRTVFSSMWVGYKGEFNDAFLNTLLNRGGVTSMLGIVALVIFACGLGGMLRYMGVIDTALEPIARRAKSGFSLVVTTLFVGYTTHLLTAATYFSIVMTGTMMSPLFKKCGYRPENCSRLTEDSGTFGGPLIPWSSNALFPMATLSVTYFEYIPWVFLLYLTPLVSVFYGLFDINMTRLTADELTQENKEVKN